MPDIYVTARLCICQMNPVLPAFTDFFLPSLKPAPPQRRRINAAVAQETALRGALLNVVKVILNLYMLALQSY